jgi:hypothetical protein
MSGNRWGILGEETIFPGTKFSFATGSPTDKKSASF